MSVKFEVLTHTQLGIPDSTLPESAPVVKFDDFLAWPPESGPSNSNGYNDTLSAIQDFFLA